MSSVANRPKKLTKWAPDPARARLARSRPASPDTSTDTTVRPSRRAATYTARSTTWSARVNDSSRLARAHTPPTLPRLSIRSASPSPASTTTASEPNPSRSRAPAAASAAPAVSSTAITRLVVGSRRAMMEPRLRKGGHALGSYDHRPRPVPGGLRERPRPGPGVPRPPGGPDPPPRPSRQRDGHPELLPAPPPRRRRPPGRRRPARRPGPLDRRPGARRREHRHHREPLHLRRAQGAAARRRPSRRAAPWPRDLTSGAGPLLSRSVRSRSSQRARSLISPSTAAVMARSKGTSWWTASTRSTPAVRSAAASSFPTSRSPYRIGSAKYPQRRLAAGLYISSW